MAADKDQSKFNSTFDLREAFKDASKQHFYYLQQSNRVWLSTVRIVLTTAVSLVTLSAVFHDKVVDLLKDATDSKLLLAHIVIGLVSYTLAIVFGVMQEIEHAKQCGDVADNFGLRMSAYLKEIDAGKQFATAKINNDETFTRNGNIYFGVLEIITFFVGIIATLIYALESIISRSSCLTYGIWLIFIFFVGCMIHRFRATIFSVNDKEKKGEK